MKKFATPYLFACLFILTGYTGFAQTHKPVNYYIDTLVLKHVDVVKFTIKESVIACHDTLVLNADNHTLSGRVNGQAINLTVSGYETGDLKKSFSSFDNTETFIVENTGKADTKNNGKPLYIDHKVNEIQGAWDYFGDESAFYLKFHMDRVAKPKGLVNISDKPLKEMDIEKISEFIFEGLDVNAYLSTPSNYHPLEIAIEMDETEYFDSPEKIKKHLELIKFLIDNGADVNKKDNWSHTPLYLACQHHVYLDTVSTAPQFYADVVELLLAKGANPNIASDRGETPLIGAVSNQNLGQVKALLAHGANNNTAVPKTKDYNSFSALELAKSVLKRARKGADKEKAQAIYTLLGGK